MLRLRNPDLQILPCLPKCIHLCRRFRHCFFSSRHLTGLEKLQAARMAKLTVLFLMEIEEQRQVKPPLWDESKPDFSSWASFKSDVCGDLPAGRPSHIKKFSELFPRSGSCIQLCNNLISPLYIKDRILCKQNNQVPSSVGFEIISMILRKQTLHNQAVNWPAWDILGYIFLFGKTYWAGQHFLKWNHGISSNFVASLCCTNLE